MKVTHDSMRCAYGELAKKKINFVGNLSLLRYKKSGE